MMSKILSMIRPAVSLFFAGLILFGVGHSAMALSSEQRRAIVSKGGKYYDVEVGCASDPSANGKIYVLGDSLTVGMETEGGLKNKLLDKSWEDILIQATNGINIADSLPKVEGDQAFVKDASTAVVGLGSNIDDDPEAKITEMIEKLRSFNDEIRIYWINLYSADDIPERQDNQRLVNRTLTNLSTELGFTVISWRAEAISNPDRYPFIPDLLHHTPEGYQAKAAFVAREVGTPPATLGGASTGGGGSNLVGDTEEEQIWNYLIGKEVQGQPLKAFHVAGIMGNMKHESAFKPQRLQNTGVDVITPATEARGSSLGWGLVQWTPAGKMIGPTLDSGKDANLINIQLDFLLEQLNGLGPSPEGPAGEALRNTSNVGDATLAFETKYERHAGSPQPQRIVDAQAILDQGFGGGGGGGDCSGGGDSGFEATVLKYAWPTYHPSPYTEAKPEYTEAIRTAQTSGQYVGGLSRPGIDCGGFVTRLMIDSGFEPNFNFSGKVSEGAGAVSGGNIRWLQENWDKITVTGTQDLKPGDVAVNAGRSHTFVFVGDIGNGPGEFEKQIASASLGSDGPPQSGWRAPMSGAENPLGSNIEWYRQR